MAILQGAASFQSLAYIAAALLFILALAGLSKQKSARNGNFAGIAGMAIALIATIVIVMVTSMEPEFVGTEAASGGSVPGFAITDTGLWVAFLLIVVALAIGAAIGVFKAKHVKMTEMPELVAMLHSFVGAAAVLVGFCSFLTDPGAEGVGLNAPD